jgi:hypothetical protein
MECAKSFITNHIRKLGRVGYNSKDLAHLKVIKSDLSVDKEVTDEIRKWFLLTYQERPSDVYIDFSTTYLDVTTAIWKAVYVAFRVLTMNEDQKSYFAIHTFPNFEMNEETFNYLVYVTSEMEEKIMNSKALGENLNYEIGAAVKHPEEESDNDMSTLIVAVKATKLKPTKANLDDIYAIVEASDKYDYTNYLEAFPFPSVYDFIAEINRPPDPQTMNQLTFKYTVNDLKETLKKSQETVDNLNCQLSRLKKWRNILVKESIKGPDPFMDTYDWGENVKNKYRSLVSQSVKNSQQAFYDQYDKPKVFIELIDSVSLMLSSPNDSLTSPLPQPVVD